jgi:hypothetical protein
MHLGETSCEGHRALQPLQVSDFCKFPNTILIYNLDNVLWRCNHQPRFHFFDACGAN